MKQSCSSSGGVLLLANLLFLGALSTHVVVTPDSRMPVFMTKAQLTLMDTYVNTGKWSPADVKAHPAVVARLVQTGHEGALIRVVGAPGDHAVIPVTAAPASPPTAAPTPPATPEPAQAKSSIFDFGKN